MRNGIATGAVSYGCELRRTCRLYKRPSSIIIDLSLTVKWGHFYCICVFFSYPNPPHLPLQLCACVCSRISVHLWQSKYIRDLTTHMNPISSRELIPRHRAHLQPVPATPDSAAPLGVLIHEVRTRPGICLASFPLWRFIPERLHFSNVHYGCTLTFHCVMTNTTVFFFFPPATMRADIFKLDLNCWYDPRLFLLHQRLKRAASYSSDDFKCVLNIWRWFKQWFIITSKFTTLRHVWCRPCSARNHELVLRSWPFKFMCKEAKDAGSTGQLSHSRIPTGTHGEQRDGVGRDLWRESHPGFLKLWQAPLPPFPLAITPRASPPPTKNQRAGQSGTSPKAGHHHVWPLCRAADAH